MLTIPKLIDPLQIALAMHPPWSFPHNLGDFPQNYQHKLLINNNLRWRIIYNGEGPCCGMSHTCGQRCCGMFFPPLTARRIRFIAESLCWPGTVTRESAWGSAGTARSSATGGGASDESADEACWPATAGFAAAETRARGSSAGANPDDAGCDGLSRAGAGAGAGARTGACDVAAGAVMGTRAVAPARRGAAG